MQGTYCCKKRKDYDKMLALFEKRVIQELPPVHNLKIFRVPITLMNPSTLETEETFIHTHKLTGPGPEEAKKTKKTVVHIHGFGGSSATYQPFLNNLSESYNVFGIDLLGMGCSGRPDIPWAKLTSSQVIDTYVESIEQWRKHMKLEKLNLIGHSFGAYFSIFYTKKYTERVASLTLFSVPCATTEPERFKQKMKTMKLSFKRKMMYYFWTFMNKKYISGYTAFSSLPMKTILNFWLKGRSDYTPAQKKVIVDFLAAQFWDRRFSSGIIPVLMGYRAYALEHPAFEEIPAILKAGIKTRIFYGSKDWIDFREVLFEIEKKGLDRDALLEVLEGSQHQMPLLEPERMAEVVKGFLG